MNKEAIPAEESPMFGFLQDIPHIPRHIRGKEYKSKCRCGGTITAERSKYNGHIHAECDKCGKRMIE